jgi:nucleoside-diphosphate-sugar epimerase
MAGDLVLLTGSTGLVGFAVLRAALEKGYKIRAAVRSEAKAETVRSNPTLKNISKDQLTFVIVPDILPEGAFDEAVKDVKYILHVASPIPAPHITGEDDLDAIIVQPAIQGTIGIFKSARKAGTVQRIVVTSSAAALVPMSSMMGEAPEDAVFGPDDRVDPLPPPYMNVPQAAYNASKVLAIKHAEEYIARENPGFDAIHIHPSVVLGRDELALTAKDLDRGSNHYALAPVLGENAPTPFPMAVCHIDGVAEAHVRALDPKVKGNQSFLLSCTGDEGYEVSYVSIDNVPPHEIKQTTTNTCSTTLQWEDIKVYTSKHFPQAVEKGLLPNSGSFAGFTLKSDPSRVEKVLGIKLKSFEEMSVDLVGQYVELLEKEGAGQKIGVVA